ncbi:MAG: FAD-dependent oxidoreductase, partial [Burkholderiaceae bacterium]
MARDVLVIGAGVVGLAVARALALAGDQVLVAEATGQIGGGVSSRNSEVLHAGLYYKPGSLKARVCVAGRAQLVAYCEARSVPYALCGKLVV